MENNTNIIHLGIIGTGRIARRFVPESKTTYGVTISAVYNPHPGSARRFADSLGISFATDNLEAFSEKIDAVYIAAPHETHAAYAKEMLSRGKHVLCEKPMSFSPNEAYTLFDLAREKKLVLMEAIKTAYCPGYRALIETVKSGAIGRICDVETCFSKLPEENVRETTDKQYGGSFTEYGTYNLLPIAQLLGVKPHTVDFSSLIENDIDIYTKALFDYKTALAETRTGLGVKREGQLLIAGTSGYLLAPSPWWLTRYFEIRRENPNDVETFRFPFEGDGLRYEIAAFAKRIREEQWQDKEGEVVSRFSAEIMKVFLKQSKRTIPCQISNL